MENDESYTYVELIEKQDISDSSSCVLYKRGVNHLQCP